MVAENFLVLLSVASSKLSFAVVKEVVAVSRLDLEVFKVFSA